MEIGYSTNNDCTSREEGTETLTSSVYFDEDDDLLENDAVPHYMLPNFASILPAYANVEAEQIRKAFSTGNYQSINRIPNKLEPDSFTNARFHVMEENRRSNQSVKGPTPKIVTKDGLFSQFDYIPSRFSMADELSKSERLQSQAKRLQVAGKDFICSTSGVKLKHESGFENANERFPYMSSPYEQARNDAIHKKWVEDNKILFGPFISTGNKQTLEKPTRKLIPIITSEIHNVLIKDWEDSTFVVQRTEDDNIAIQFEEATVESEKGLVAYMNVFSRTHALISKYSLHRVVDDWNVKPGDGFIYFVFRPPWVKVKHNESFISNS